MHYAFQTCTKHSLEPYSFRIDTPAGAYQESVPWEMAMAKRSASTVSTSATLASRSLAAETISAIARFLAYYAALYVARICDAHYPHLRPQLDQIIARLSPARHSEDFTQVYWFGKTYTFTPIRARVIKALWHHWLAGTPIVGARHLANVACCETQKMSDIFKDDAAYGAMVKSDGLGRYWLEPPADAVMLMVKMMVRLINRALGRGGMIRFTSF